MTDQRSEAATATDGSPSATLGPGTRSGQSRAVRAARRVDINRWRPASIRAATQITLIAVTVANLATNFDRINYVNFPTAAGLSLLIGVATLILAVGRWRIAGPLAVAYGLVFAIRERVNTEPFQGSDVLLATNEAIGVMVSGGNPYSHFYESTIPPGAPFPYLIGEPFFYWLHIKVFGSTDYADQWSSILILVLLASLAPILGWTRAAVAVMGYGISAQVLNTVSDGSNDTSMSLLIVGGLVVLLYSQWDRTPERWRTPILILSAVVFAWALLFKLFALIIFPFIVIALWRRQARWVLFSFISVGIALLAMLPYLIDDFGGVVNYVSRGGSHDFIWGYNLWTIIEPTAPGFVSTIEPWITFIQYGVAGSVGAALLVRVRGDIAQAALFGVATCSLLVLLANWTSGSYWVGFWPIVVAGAVTIGIRPLNRLTAPIRVLRIERALPTWLVGTHSAAGLPRVSPASVTDRASTRRIVVNPNRASPRQRAALSHRIGQVQASTSTDLLVPTSLGWGDHAARSSDSTPRAIVATHPSDMRDLPRLWRLAITWIWAATARLGSRVQANVGTVSMVIFATIIGAALRLWQVGSNPPGIHQDEAVAGYDAWSLWLTLRDHHGNPFPWVGFETFGDWVSPVLSFYLAPWVGLLGPDIAVIRVATALLGIAAIPLAFLATRELVNRSETAIVAASLLAISPWAVQMSRYAIPPATIAPLVLLALWLVVRSLRLRTTGSFVLAMFAVSLLVSSYPTMKLYVPLLAGAFAVIYFRIWQVFPLRALLWGGAALILAIGPVYAFSLLSPTAQNRTRYLSYLASGEASPAGLLGQYWSYISPAFLFQRGDGDASHVQPGYGLEFSWLVPFLVFGLVLALLRAINPDLPLRLRRPAMVLLAAFLLAPVPAAITRFQNSSRVAEIDPLIAILMAIGIVGVFDIGRRVLKPRGHSLTFRVVSVALAALIVLPLAAQARDRYRDYFIDYPRDYAVQWHYHAGIIDTLRYVRTIEDEYDEIYVGDVAQGYIVLFFVNHIDPSTVQFNLDPGTYDDATYRVSDWEQYRLYSGRNDGPTSEELGVDLDAMPVIYESFTHENGVGYVVRSGSNRNGQPILIIQNETR